MLKLFCARYLQAGGQASALAAASGRSEEEEGDQQQQQPGGPGQQAVPGLPALNQRLNSGNYCLAV